MQQVWFITGSSRGFGRALASAALDAGDRVVATARQPSAISRSRRWASSSAMRTAGRAAVTTSGGEWPTDLDEGVRRFVDQALPGS